jgi:lipase chaperone LimK
MNNKITIVAFLVSTFSVFTFFVLDKNIGVEKPIMNDEFQPLLASNEFAFQKSLSPPLNSVENFSKPIPKSLQGIDLNIELPLDADGNLIVGMEVKDLFEIYLSAMGEEELDNILLRIQGALAQQLSSPALEQGYGALKRFIDYKVELANLEGQASDPALNELDRIRRQKEILAAIQQEYFSPTEVDALFAAETQYDDFMLEHLTIQQNEHLTPKEKQLQVEALEALLPEDIRTVRESVMAPAKVYQQAQSMREQGHTAADVYTLRAELLGEEAATALAKLDQDREQWQQRLNTFTAEYGSISASGLSLADQEVEVSALLDRNFTATESIRIRALTGL